MRSLLLVVGCVVFVVCRRVRCLFCVVHGVVSLFVVRCPLLVARCYVFVVCSWLVVVCCWLFVVGCLLFDVCCLFFWVFSVC